MTGVTLQEKSFHPIIWLVYPLRVLAQATTTFIVGATLYAQGNEFWVPYLLLGIEGFIYPHLNLLALIKSKDPKKLEFYFLIFDSFVLGAWIAYMNYALFPTMVIIIGNTMANFSIGSFQLALKGWGAFLLGIIIVSIFHGIHFQPSTSIFAASFSVGFLLFFCSAMGYFTFKRAAELKDTRGQLLAANQKVDSLSQTLASASANLELKNIMRQIYEFFNALFPFDFITLQIADLNRNELRFRSHHSLIATQKEKDLYMLHIPLDQQNCLSVKTYTDDETLFIPNVNTSDDLSFLDKNIREIIDFSSVLYLPLVTDTEIIGVIGFYSREKMMIDKKILHLIKLQLSTLSLILRNAILYEDVKKNISPNTPDSL